MTSKYDFKSVYYKDPVHGVNHIPNAVVINLLSSKGPNVSGKLLYLQDLQFDLQEPQQEKFKDKVIICDHLDFRYYAVLSAMSAKAVIANSVDYQGYRDTMIINTTVGVIGGFGKFNFDEPLVDFFKNNSDITAHLDTTFPRLIIEIEKKPKFLLNYVFDPTLIISYK